MSQKNVRNFNISKLIFFWKKRMLKHALKKKIKNPSKKNFIIIDFFNPWTFLNSFKSFKWKTSYEKKQSHFIFFYAQLHLWILLKFEFHFPVERFLYIPLLHFFFHFSQLIKVVQEKHHYKRSIPSRIFLVYITAMEVCKY